MRATCPYVLKRSWNFAFARWIGGIAASFSSSAFQTGIGKTRTSTPEMDVRKNSGPNVSSIDARNTDGTLKRPFSSTVVSALPRRRSILFPWKRSPRAASRESPGYPGYPQGATVSHLFPPRVSGSNRADVKRNPFGGVRCGCATTAVYPRGGDRLIPFPRRRAPRRHRRVLRCAPLRTRREPRRRRGARHRGGLVSSLLRKGVSPAAVVGRHGPPRGPAPDARRRRPPRAARAAAAPHARRRLRPPAALSRLRLSGDVPLRHHVRGAASRRKGDRSRPRPPSRGARGIDHAGSRGERAPRVAR